MSRQERGPQEESFGQAVRTFRRQNNIIRRVLCSASGVSERTLIDIEEEKTKPRRRTVATITRGVRVFASEDDPSAKEIYRLDEDEGQKELAILVQSLEVGDLLRALRGGLGISREQMAIKADVSRVTLAKYEKGEPSDDRVKIEAVGRIADEETLFEWNDKREPTALGVQLRRLRKENGLTEERLAELVGVNVTTIGNIERGTVQDINTQTRDGIIRAVRHVGGPMPGSITEEILALLQRREGEVVGQSREEQWLQTIANVPYSMVIRCLLIEEQWRQKEFVKESEMDRTVLFNKRMGRTSLQNSINRLIVAAGLQQNGKAAQYLRLKNVGQEIMSRSVLEHAPAREITSYIRTLLGLTQSEVATQIEMKKDVVNSVESGKWKSRKKAYIDAFIKGLDLSDHPLSEVLRHKVDGDIIQISDEKFRLIREGNLLFGNDAQRFGSPAISAEDASLRTKIKAEASSFGDALRIIREIKHLKQQELKQKMRIEGEGSRSTIARLENGIHIPHDSTVARLGIALGGYTVHHPIMWDLLELVEQDRQRQKLARKRT